MEEAERKAREDLVAEQARSRNLSNDVDRLKKALREKEDAILQFGKLIEDLWVDKTELALSYKKIERANTDLVGENMALEEKIRVKSSMPLCLLCWSLFSFLSSDSVSRSLQGLRMICWQPRLTPNLLRHSLRERSSSWELEPANEMGEAARGDALVDQLCYLGTTLRDRVRDTLHTGVKQAMAIVFSGFSYDMEVVSHDFVTDISKTDAVDGP